MDPEIIPESRRSLAGPTALVAASLIIATLATPLAPTSAKTVEVQDQAVATVVDDVPPDRPRPLPPETKPIVVDHTPRVGSKGPEILAIEQRLSDLHYMVGKVDGTFDRATQHGVTAFQKVEGLRRTGRGEPETLDRLANAGTPSPRYASPADHLEVDIARQVVFVVRAGSVSAILPTSTGNNRPFTSQGWTRKAITPNGQFKIFRKIPKMRISPLGELYKPSYFNGGIAFHGNGSVPTYPASHGCVRLPMPFADWFFANASPIGMVVYVYGGPTGPNPQPTVEDKPAPDPSPTPEPSPSPSPSPVPTAPVPTGTAT